MFDRDHIRPPGCGACGPVLPMPGGPYERVSLRSTLCCAIVLPGQNSPFRAYRCIYLMSQYAMRLLLSAFWPAGYVAPVEQCCLCPVGLIRYVACAAGLPIPSGAGMQKFVPLERCTACLFGFDGVWTFRAISQGSKCPYMIGRDLV